MSSVNDRIEKAKERLEQLKHQKKLQDMRERKAKQKTDIRRYIIIGEMVCKYFPEVMLYQPRKTNTENAEEFSHLDDFLQELSISDDIVAKIKEGACMFSPIRKT